MCLLAAKEQTTRRMQRLHPDWDEGIIKSKLIAYTSGNYSMSSIFIEQYLFNFSLEVLDKFFDRL